MVQYERFGCSSWAKSLLSSFGRTIMGKAIRESFFFKLGWEKFRMENAYLITEKQRTILVYADYLKLAGKKQNISPTWKCLWKTLIWEKKHHSLIMCIWVAFKEDAKQARMLWIITEVRLKLGFLLVLWKNYQKRKLQGNLRQTLSLRGPMTWKVMRRNAWKDVASWRIKEFNNYIKSQHHAWMTIIFKTKKNGSVGEMYLLSAHKWLWNVLGSYWWTRYLACEQTCSCSHKITLGFWQNSSGPLDSNPVHWHQISSRRHFDQR